jgi:hypothetical protein
MKTIDLLSQSIDRDTVISNLTDGIRLPDTVVSTLLEEFKERLWRFPDGWVKVDVARKRAVELLIPAGMEKIHQAWDLEVPSEIWPRIQRGTGKSVRHAVTALTDRYGRNIVGTGLLERYWEPAESSRPIPGTITELHLQACRWAAAIVGAEVRNSDLENIHALYTSDDSMPTLNRGVRNAAFEVMLADPWVGHYLAQWPGFILFLKANGVPVSIPPCCQPGPG